MLEVTGFRTPGLGDTTYLVTYAGLGVLVDVQRDVDRFLDAAGRAGVEPRWVLDTHLHNDYVSGAWEAARRSGAEVVLPAGAGAAYPHTLAFHGEDLVEGDLAVRPLHTPGHTPEHTSYLVLTGGEPLALFSGGSLLVGSAGRCDLLGEHRAWQLAVAQFGSLQRLASLPDRVALYPTHGRGSFCTSASAAGRSSSTVGEERRSNPVLRHRDARSFAAAELEDLPPYPRYYAHVGPVNVSGPGPMPRTRPRLLDARDAAATGAAVVDARPRARAASQLVPGSVAVELSEQFGVWVGWLLSYDAPLVLVIDPEQDADDALVQLARIGFEQVQGIVHDVAGWPGGLDAYGIVDVEGAVKLLDGGATLLDVRAPDEWDDGRIEEAVRCYLPDIATGPPGGVARDRPVVVACASGYRSAAAASLLTAQGFETVVLDEAGMPDLAARLAG